MAGPPNTDVTVYAWDHRNRLVSITDYATEGDPPTKEVFYTYDVHGRRIAKRIDDPADGTIDREERYVYDGDHIALRLVDADGDGTQQTLDLANRYLHGPAIDQVLADEQVHYDGVSDYVTDHVYWPLADHLGTIRDLAEYTAGTTSVVNHLVYAAFGQIVSESDTTVDHEFAYTGRERDDESDLFYYRARYYDAAVAEFISEDPIGFRAGDVNLGRYVGNRATSATDPFGLQSKLWRERAAAVGELTRKTGRLRSYGTDITEGAAVLGAAANAPLDVLINNPAEYFRQAQQAATGYFWDAPWGALKGGVQALAHPIEAGRGVFVAVTNPGKTLSAIKDEVTKVALYGDARAQGKMANEIVMIFLPSPGAAVRAASYAKKVGGKARQLVGNPKAPRLVIYNTKTGKMRDLGEASQHVGKLVDKADLDRAAGKAREYAATGARIIGAWDDKAEAICARFRKTPDDVSRISKNTGVPKKYLQKMKEHVMYNEHDIPVGPNQVARGRFSADPDIARLWEKAYGGQLNRKELGELKDYLAHEYTEYALERSGVPFRDPSSWTPDRGFVPTPKHHGAHDLAPLAVPGQRHPFQHLLDLIPGMKKSDLR